MLKLPRSAHTLNLCVKDCLDSTHVIKEIFQNVKGIIAHFKRSPQAMAKLKDEQSDRSVKLGFRQIAETRWIFSYYVRTFAS